MASKKSDLIERIKRRLGYPTVKVELDVATIADHIDYARQRWIKWAVGNATQEFYFTVMLSAGQTMYPCPSNTTEIIGYSSETAGTIHTLFTMENYLYNQGMYDQLLMRGASSGYTLISYHIARDFLDTVKRYVVDAYSYIYHPYTNMIEIQPPPPSGGSIQMDDQLIYNTPGFILIRGYKAEGTEDDVYSSMWIVDFATAMCKLTLGRIRAKFASFTSIGNTGLALDGDQLISEGTADIEKLEEQLRMEEPHEGGWIIIG
jgi:hypothetical protein